MKLNKKKLLELIVCVFIALIIVLIIIYKSFYKKHNDAFTIDTTKKYILKNTTINDTLSLIDGIKIYYTNSTTSKIVTSFSFTSTINPDKFKLVIERSPGTIIFFYLINNSKLNVTDIYYNFSTKKLSYQILDGVEEYIDNFEAIEQSNNSTSTTAGATSSTAGSTSTTTRATSTTADATSTTTRATSTTVGSTSSTASATSSTAGATSSTAGATSSTAGATSSTVGSTSSTAGATSTTLPTTTLATTTTPTTTTIPTTTRPALDIVLDNVQEQIDKSNNMLQTPRYTFIDNQQRLDKLTQRVNTLMNNLQLNKNISMTEKKSDVTFY